MKHSHLTGNTYCIYISKNTQYANYVQYNNSIVTLNFNHIYHVTWKPAHRIDDDLLESIKDTMYYEALKIMYGVYLIIY